MRTVGFREGNPRKFPTSRVDPEISSMLKEHHTYFLKWVPFLWGPVDFHIFHGCNSIKHTLIGSSIGVTFFSGKVRFPDRSPQIAISGDVCVLYLQVDGDETIELIKDGDKLPTKNCWSSRASTQMLFDERS